jgi:hypothetical protein
MTNNGITENQLRYLLDLRIKKGLQDKFTEADAAALTREQASRWIDKAKDLPSVTTAPARSPIFPHEDDVPAGRYAIEEGGVLKFFVVDRPTEGHWAGWVFLKIQASDETYRIKDRARCEFIYKAIAHDPAAASRRYGIELGHCGVCGRTLTDPESIARGIGPVCAGRMGW